MDRNDRREFLAEVGQGMVTVLVGSALAADLGLPQMAEGKEAALPAGLDRLAKRLLETPPSRLLDVYQDEVKRGTALRTLVAGAALANARAFRGQDYDGYHTFMALPPAFVMAGEMPADQKHLPIFKVLYRNSTLIHASSKKDILGEEEPAPVKDDATARKQLLEAVRGSKIQEADRIVTALCKKPVEQVYEELQPLVHDVLNVHRVVLAWRSWEILEFTGKEHARTMLRQTVRHCANYREHSIGHEAKGIRDVLPRLLETHRLLGKKPGRRLADDTWIERLARTLHAGKKEEAAGAVAEALAEGFAPDAVAEAMGLAATALVLGDRGRIKGSPGKPPGSVHGDSVGVHASDAANAWRRIAGVSTPRTTFASLIAGAYHTAGQARNQMPQPYPLAEDRDKVTATDADRLLAALDEAIRGNDQPRACAVTQRYGQLGLDAQGVFRVLRRYAVSEDGALHAEKYYHTVKDEFARTRSALRWRHLVALARVTASAHGRPAPGLAEARKAFKV